MEEKSRLNKDISFHNFLLNNAISVMEKGLIHYGKNNENIDKIIVWIVGFSITIIALLLANFSGKNPFFEKSGNIIIILAGLTILLGVLQRIVMVLFNKMQLDLIFSFENFMIGYNLSGDTKYTRTFSQFDNIEEVLNYLKEDFNIDYKGQFSIPPKETDEYTALIKKLISIYNERQEKLLLFEAKIFNEIMIKKFGFEFSKGINGEKVSSNTQNIWKLLKWSNWLFYLMCFFFLALIFTAVIAYLCI